MARADFTIGGIEGYALGGDIDPGPASVYGASGSLGWRDTFGPGTVGRKEAYVTLIVAGFMVIYWRAAKGY